MNKNLVIHTNIHIHMYMWNAYMSIGGFIYDREFNEKLKARCYFNYSRGGLRIGRLSLGT